MQKQGFVSTLKDPFLYFFHIFLLFVPPLLCYDTL